MVADLRRTHPVAPFVLLDVNLLVHLGHALLDLGAAAEEYGKVEDNLLRYRRGLMGEETAPDQASQVGWYMGAASGFLADSLSWDALSRTDVSQLYPRYRYWGWPTSPRVQLAGDDASGLRGLYPACLTPGASFPVQAKSTRDDVVEGIVSDYSSDATKAGGDAELIRWPSEFHMQLIVTYAGFGTHFAFGGWCESRYSKQRHDASAQWRTPFDAFDAGLAAEGCGPTDWAVRKIRVLITHAAEWCAVGEWEVACELCHSALVGALSANDLASARLGVCLLAKVYVGADDCDSVTELIECFASSPCAPPPQSDPNRSLAHLYQAAALSCALNDRKEACQSWLARMRNELSEESNPDVGDWTIVRELSNVP